MRRFFIAVSAGLFVAGLATPALALTNRELWKGPGVYWVMRTEYGFMIWSNPYKSQSACEADWHKRFANKEYAKSMQRKYGPYGNYEVGFAMYCIEMKTREDAPPR